MESIENVKVFGAFFDSSKRKVFIPKSVVQCLIELKNAELLMKVLGNAEPAALLTSLAKTMKV